MFQEQAASWKAGTEQLLPSVLPGLGYQPFLSSSQTGNRRAAEITEPSSSLRLLPCALLRFDPLFKALLHTVLLGDTAPHGKPCFRMQKLTSAAELGARVSCVSGTLAVQELSTELGKARGHSGLT